MRCLDCSRSGRLKARGICWPCYRRRMRQGTLDERPLAREPGRSREEVLEDYLVIREDCRDLAQAADRMGMSEGALEACLRRARLAGYAEALPPPAQIDRAIRRRGGLTPDKIYVRAS